MNTDKFCRSRGNEAQTSEAVQILIKILEISCVISCIERIYDSRFTIYDDAVNLAENLENIQQRIRLACERAGRDPASVTLLAVAKSQPPEAVAAAAQLGLNLFGENKMQEARAKIPLCPGRLRWHFIGHLQSNKCRDAVELFEMIQSVDSLPLAMEIAKRAGQAGKTMPILLEVNMAGETSKFGYAPEKLLAELESINALPKIEIHGLMAVPPWSSEPGKSRPHFQRLREIKERCEQILGAPLPHLSMGMSGDFEVAIEEGATMVRIGTALFGPRSRAKTGETAG
jgi:PLP dependent protein